MFKAWKKKRILKKYLKRLPIDLANRYGAQSSYSIGQLQSTLDDKGYPIIYRGYASVIFLSNEDAAEHLGNQRLVDHLTREIAEKFFNGDAGFKVKLEKQRATGNSGHCSMGGDPSGAGD